jgi:hypothetical protein
MSVMYLEERILLIIDSVLRTAIQPQLVSLLISIRVNKDSSFAAISSKNCVLLNGSFNFGPRCRHAVG